MTTFDFGDVVLVPFPFTDLIGRKNRPAVVISPATYQRLRPDCILLAITSQLGAVTGFGEASIQGWRHAGLLKPSVFKPVAFTFEQKDIPRRLGVLAPDDQAALSQLLQRIIGPELNSN